MKLMGWMKRCRRKVESIFIPVSPFIHSFQHSTGYSSICQEVEADDPSLKTRREVDTFKGSPDFLVWGYMRYLFKVNVLPTVDGRWHTCL